MDEHSSDQASVPTSEVPETPRRQGLLASEDWWAVWIGGTLLLLTILAVVLNRPDEITEGVSTMVVETVEEVIVESAKTDSEKEKAALEKKVQKEFATLKTQAVAPNPLKDWFAKPGSWSDNPLDSLFIAGKRNVFPGLVGMFVVSIVAFGLGIAVMGQSSARFAGGFGVVFLLATLAYVMAGQDVVKAYNLEYALWALLVGLVISNSMGTPAFVKPAVRTEFYIKTGLVILGAEVLFSRLLQFGVPGIFVAWVVTPIVLIATYAFGQRVLKMESPSLNMVIAADMSVCGVSAAIATAAACKAKKEELSLAVGMSLSFTVVMMVVMPALIKAVGMSDVLGGAWMGGTIDSTGAVAAAGGILGDTALKVAATIKMIQNILIGVTAFGVAVYWVTVVEKDSSGSKPNAMEIWYRFPKFVLGFVAASVVFSIIYAAVPDGEALVDSVKTTSKTMRGWFFCLAFVSIGLETNFRELGQYFKGGKPLLLYVCGQSLNLCLTLLMAWLMFEVVFRENMAEFLGK